MSQKPTSIPPKVLYQSILSTGMSFILNNIEGWDGNNLTSADFGTQAFGAFINADRTLIEFFEFDPSTIANSSITILYRGLGFSGSQTPVTANKLDWTANETTVLLGTDTPQFMALLASLVNDNAFTGANSFTQLPTSTGGNATSGTQLITYAQAIALATGTASINRVVVAGTAGETLVSGQIIYLKAADNRWWKASSAASATAENVTLGIAQGAGTAGVSITSGVLLFGLDSNQTGLTANTLYYLSTGGAMATSAGTKSVQLGFSQSTTSILFCPNFNLLLTQDQQNALVGNNTDIAVGTGNKFVTQTGLQHNAEKYVLCTSGSSTDYTGTYSPVPTSITNGMEFFLKIDVANTTATPTFNPNGLGVKTIVKGTSTALVANDLIIGQVAHFIYDGTNMVLQNPSTATPSVSSYVGAVYSDSKLATINVDTTYTTNFTPKNITLYFAISGADSGTAIKSSGIATFNGTTLTSVMYFVYQGTSTAAITNGTVAFSNNALTCGGTSGNSNTVTLTVQSVSSTQFVIRAAYLTTSSTTGSIAYYPVATQ